MRQKIQQIKYITGLYIFLVFDMIKLKIAPSSIAFAFVYIFINQLKQKPYDFIKLVISKISSNNLTADILAIIIFCLCCIVVFIIIYFSMSLLYKFIRWWIKKEVKEYKNIIYNRLAKQITTNKSEKKEDIKQIEKTTYSKTEAINIIKNSNYGLNAKYLAIKSGIIKDCGVLTENGWGLFLREFSGKTYTVEDRIEMAKEYVIYEKILKEINLDNNKTIDITILEEFLKQKNIETANQWLNTPAPSITIPQK